MDPNFKTINDQIRRIYASVVWTHKIQECCADILTTRDKCFKTVQIVLSVLTTTGLLVTVFGEEKWVVIVSAIISAIAMFINLYLKGNNLQDQITRHAQSARGYLALRAEYLSLLVDIKSGSLDMKGVVAKRDALQGKLDDMNNTAPRTFDQAVNRAAEQLNVKHDSSYEDEEIDSFLFGELKSKK